MAQEENSLDELYDETLESYREFRHHVDEYMNHATRCKDLIKRFDGSFAALSKDDKLLQEEKRAQTREMSSFLPKDNSLILKLFVGDFNVVLPRKVDKIKYKRQYEIFKLWYVIGQLAFSVINMLFGPYRIIEGLLQFYLVWFYCNLTMKESILVMNGSKIRTWWLVQHYLDVILYGFLLIRPDGEFSQQFSLYIFYMSGCQLLQFYYQDGSLYRLRALGRANSMEVSAEGIRVKTFADLAFLLPFLMLLYLFQSYNGYTLWWLSSTAKYDERWEVVVCALLFFSISAGNIFTLIQVMVLKYKINIRKRNADTIRRSLSAESLIGRFNPPPEKED